MFATLLRLYQYRSSIRLCLLSLLMKIRPNENQTRPLKFGCLGAANITSAALVTPSLTHPEVSLYAIAARDKSRADRFAQRYGFQKSYGGSSAYQDLTEDPEVDAVYIPLPNGLHFEWTMKALHAGKHVLLEKPATNTAEEAEQIFALAEQKQLVVLEAFHYRFHPAIQRVKQILDSRELGTVKSISVALTAPEGFVKPDDIRWQYELGGGSIMDPGSYAVNVLLFLSSSNYSSVLTATVEHYSPKPEHAKIDKSFKATLSLPKDILGALLGDLCEPRIFGIIPRIPRLKAIVECEGGTVEIVNFLVPHFYHTIIVLPKEKVKRVEKAYSFNGDSKGEEWWSTYRYQLEAFVDKVCGRQPQHWVEPQETIGNTKCIEEIYAKTGLGRRPRSELFQKLSNHDFVTPKQD